MSNESLMRKELPETTLPSTAKFLGDGAASIGNKTAQEVARDWYAAGAKEMKQDALAPVIGVDSSALSQMVTGTRQRHIYLVHALPLLENVSTAQAFIGWACRRARLVEPQPVDTIAISNAEARLLSWLRRTAIWTLFLGEMIAREFYRCERDLLEVAIDNTLRIEK